MQDKSDSKATIRYDIKMPRARTDRIIQVKSELIARVRSGRARAEQRFPSSRTIARWYSISYQTAHRLLHELAEEGWLERHASSGTFHALRRTSFQLVHLIFNPRAQRPDSFGQRLLQMLSHELEDLGLPFTVSLADHSGVPQADAYPVFWETEVSMMDGQFALVLNNRPAVGLAAAFLDSISTDDFSGGVCAAELFRHRNGLQAPTILEGDPGDTRNRERVAGFKSIFPRAKLVTAGSWYYEDARNVASSALRLGRRGLFCCNDRLASAVMDAAEEQQLPLPPLIGFDDAPVAEALALTTIALPWHEIVRSAAELIRRRLDGDTTSACRQVFAPYPVIRRTYQPPTKSMPGVEPKGRHPWTM